MHEHKYEEAQRELDRALELEPGLPFALADLLNALTELDPQSAAEQGQRLVEQMPDNAAIWFEYAGALRKLERFGDAVEAARSAVRLARDDQHWFRVRLADTLAKSGRVDEAEACYKTLLDENPDSPRYRQWYTEFLTQYRTDRPAGIAPPGNNVIRCAFRVGGVVSAQSSLPPRGPGT